MTEEFTDLFHAHQNQIVCQETGIVTKLGKNSDFFQMKVSFNKTSYFAKEELPKGKYFEAMLRKLVNCFVLVQLKPWSSAQVT